MTFIKNKTENFELGKDNIKKKRLNELDHKGIQIFRGLSY